MRQTPRRFREIARVASPVAGRNTSKNRPEVGVSDARAFNAPSGHSVMAMITSHDNLPSPLDCVVADLAAAGLPAPSMVRLKLFTLDDRLVRGAAGRLSPADIAQVSAGLSQLLGGIS